MTPILVNPIIELVAAGAIDQRGCCGVQVIVAAWQIATWLTATSVRLKRSINSQNAQIIDVEYMRFNGDQPLVSRHKLARHER